MTPDRAEQRAIAKKIVDREYDQVLRMWMPYDNGFLVFPPTVRNGAALALRRTDGYGASALARLPRGSLRKTGSGREAVAATRRPPDAVAIVWGPLVGAAPCGGPRSFTFVFLFETSRMGQTAM